MKFDVSYDTIKALFDQYGYPLTDGITPFAIRNNLWIPDKFNDVLGIVNGKNVLAYSGTTKPGLSPLQRDDVHQDGAVSYTHLTLPTNSRV